MQLLHLLNTNLVFFISCSVVLGLLIGSFLNVVITRLPVILERGWKSECQQLLAIDNSAADELQKFNLITPRSQCPSCKHIISSLENIPLLSYLFQKGKCRHCGTSISAQYPLIELFTALFTGLIAFKFGFNWQALFAMVLGWSLITLAMIDFRTTLLPDNITLPILWLGIIANYFNLFCSLEESVLGAIFGYLSLWLVFQVFKLITGKEGMGYGDFKLLALLGAWLGWHYLIAIILISSVVGSIIGISLIVTKILGRDVPTPFGPYLALGGIICLIWGPEVKSLFGSM
ncbi:MAG: prepilin peptidase [Gammaproteobacteria bacterium]|nr:prepilin peptidase [Gammaproteobacteria bacterium]